MEVRITSSMMLLIGLAGCGGSGDGSGSIALPPLPDGLISTPKTALELKIPPSCDAFESYLSDSIADLVLNLGMIDCPACDVRVAIAEAPAPGAPDANEADAGRVFGLGPAAGGGFDAFTGTNNQESGVDELDSLEADADGNFYFIDGQHLVIANGLPPADLRQIASLELGTEGYAHGLVLDPDNARLVILVSRFGFFGIADVALLPPEPYAQTVELLFVDVADPATPVIDRRLKISGFELALRRIRDRVHLVSHFTPSIPPILTTDSELVDLRRRYAEAKADESDTADALAAEIRALVAGLVAAGDIADFLPELQVQDGLGPYLPVSTANCADVAIPDVTMPFALTSVTSVDSDGTDLASLAVANNAWSVYASEQNLYLSQTSGGWWFSDRQRQQTAIYKIEIGQGRPVYRALGTVDGWAQSSFQLSEYGGYLRVVTHRAEFDPSVDTRLEDNNLYVLGDDAAGSMNVVGSVIGFGKTERIFSSRFLGERGFVVTFRQIDPLFTFDLSIPEDPRLVGEVEIPGVSTYIHPLDANHLLTIGFDGDENRLNGQFQLQIFDVQTLEAPRLVHKYVPKFDAEGFAWTSAVFDHLAFNYFAAAGTLTVPVQYYARELDDHFSGFAAFSVDVAAGFAELGRLDHSELARLEHCLDAVDVVCRDGIYLQAATPRRAVSALIGDRAYIYTLSDVALTASPADAFDEPPVAVLPLPFKNSYFWLALE